MSDMHGETMGDGPKSADADGKLMGIAEQVKGDIELGHVDQDVSTELRQRADQAGVEVRDEDLETVANEIENGIR